MILDADPGLKPGATFEIYSNCSLSAKICLPPWSANIRAKRIDALRDASNGIGLLKTLLSAAARLYSSATRSGRSAFAEIATQRAKSKPSEWPRHVDANAVDMAPGRSHKAELYGPRHKRDACATPCRTNSLTQRARGLQRKHGEETAVQKEVGQDRWNECGAADAGRPSSRSRNCPDRANPA